MPRNSSGVYTLPAGNPVAPNTVIETAWANPTMSDLGAAITDSLDRYGRGTMLAAMKLIDGSAAAPALSFNSESTTGLYRPSSGILGFSVGGLQRATMDATGVKAAAGLTFSGAGTSAGSFAMGPLDASGGILLTGRGTGSGNVQINPLADNGSGSCFVRLFRDTNTTGIRQFILYRGDGTVTQDHNFACGGASSASIAARIGIGGGRVTFGTQADDGVSDVQTTGVLRVNGTVWGALGVRDGATAYGGPAPHVAYDGIALDSIANTGISILTPATGSGGIAFGNPTNVVQGAIQYAHSTDVLQFITGGATRASVSAAGITSLTPFLAPDGSAAAPSYAFSSQPTWGMYRVPGQGVGWSFNGVEMARLAAAGLTFSAGAAYIAHNDTTTSLALVGASSNVDATARLELFDTAHATLARQSFLRGAQISFTSSTAATYFGKWDATGNLLVNVSTVNATFPLANRGVVEAGGTNSGVFGISAGATAVGFVQGDASAMRVGTIANLPCLFLQNNAEVARLAVGGTFTYAGNEVGWRDLPQTAAGGPLSRGMVTPLAGGATIATQPANSCIALFNNTAAAVTLTQSGITLRLAGTTLTGNRTLAAWGWATIWYLSTSVAVITGNVS